MLIFFTNYYFINLPSKISNLYAICYSNILLLVCLLFNNNINIKNFNKLDVLWNSKAIDAVKESCLELFFDANHWSEKKRDLRELNNVNIQANNSNLHIEFFINQAIEIHKILNDSPLIGLEQSFILYSSWTLWFEMIMDENSKSSLLYYLG